MHWQRYERDLASSDRHLITEMNDRTRTVWRRQRTRGHCDANRRPLERARILCMYPRKCVNPNEQSRFPRV